MPPKFMQDVRENEIFTDGANEIKLKFKPNKIEYDQVLARNKRNIDTKIPGNLKTTEKYL